jgi:cbb3-type cytochrome oxidase maturation protein
MTVLIIMIPMALILGFGFVMAFIVSMKTGQYDDLETPAHRMLKEDSNGRTNYE